MFIRYRREWNRKKGQIDENAEIVIKHEQTERACWRKWNGIPENRGLNCLIII